MNRAKSVEAVTEEQIVQELISQISNGVLPWRKPWSDICVVIGGMLYPEPRSMLPSNVRAPKVPYGVLNGLLLWAQATAKSYRTNLWLSATAVEQLNAQLVEGDRLPVMLEVGYGRGLKYNIDQIVDCEVALGLSFQRSPHTESKQPHKLSERLLDKLCSKQKLKIKEQEYAAYSPKHDYIMMPNMNSFQPTTIDGRKTSAEANYWATLWHEVIHWTGHDSRLNRKRHEQWGDDTYAFEELIAELGSAFLCRHLRVDGEMQHASYLQSWSRQLRNPNNNAFESIREAAKDATLAKEFVLKPVDEQTT